MKIVFVIVLALVLVVPALSCSSAGTVSAPPATSVAISASPATTTEDAGPRFVITQSATPAFSPTSITPTSITPTSITPTGISPVRDLTGTWQGAGVSYWIDGANGARVARTHWNVTLVITSQSGTSVQGTLTMVTASQENLGAADIPKENYGPDNITNGAITGTTLDFDDDDWHWTFTFTTDLMSGQYDDGGPGVSCDPKAFTLSRQH